MGVLYYAIYAPARRRKPPLEVYKLQENSYGQPELVEFGAPLWLPEIGLGIGRERGIYQGSEREWLYWYDEAGNRYLTPEEQAIAATKLAQQERQLAQQERQLAQQEYQRAEQEYQRAEQAQAQMQALIAKLREQGLTPEQLRALGIDTNLP
jgi:hypothetical protein